MQLSNHRNVCVLVSMAILHLETGSLHKLDLEFQYKSIKQSICIWHHLQLFLLKLNLNNLDF